MAVAAHPPAALRQLRVFVELWRASRHYDLCLAFGTRDLCGGGKGWSQAEGKGSTPREGSREEGKGGFNSRLSSS